MSRHIEGNLLDRVAPLGGLTLGVELPLDNDWSEVGQRRAAAEGRPFGVPDMAEHDRLARLADALGFSAIWMRDVPVHDPEFGDAGQVFDPFPYLGYLAGRTRRIALGTAAIVVPLRPPILLAKMTATIHELSGGRFIFGAATGDRPVEFPLMGLPFESRGADFRATMDQVRDLWRGASIASSRGPITVRPQVGKGPPVVMAGMGQQTLQWIAREMQGWFSYPGPRDQLRRRIDLWRAATRSASGRDKPFLTAMHLDLAEDPEAPFEPFRFGGRMGRHRLIEEIRALAEIGVNHLSLNFRPSHRPVAEVMEELGREILTAIGNNENSKEGEFI